MGLRYQLIVFDQLHQIVTLVLVFQVLLVAVLIEVTNLLQDGTGIGTHGPKFVKIKTPVPLSDPLGSIKNRTPGFQPDTDCDQEE
jgi:hypothetical protein